MTALLPGWVGSPPCSHSIQFVPISLCHLSVSCQFPKERTGLCSSSLCSSVAAGTMQVFNSICGMNKYLNLQRISFPFTQSPTWLQCEPYQFGWGSIYNSAKTPGQCTDLSASSKCPHGGTMKCSLEKFQLLSS